MLRCIPLREINNTSIILFFCSLVFLFCNTFLHLANRATVHFGYEYCSIGYSIHNNSVCVRTSNFKCYSLTNNSVYMWPTKSSDANTECVCVKFKRRSTWIAAYLPSLKLFAKQQHTHTHICNRNRSISADCAVCTEQKMSERESNATCG